MTLKEFLPNEVKIGEIVVIREAGYKVGMTRVDNEKLFIRSLSEPKTVLYGEGWTVQNFIKEISKYIRENQSYFG